MFYGTICDFKDYIFKRNIEISETFNDIAIEQALLIASEWLDSVYSDIWVGYKTERTQERSWPRKNATETLYPYYYTYLDNEIPEPVIHATYEAAYRYLNDNTYLRKDFVPNKYTQVSVTGAVSVIYNNGVSSSSDNQNQIPIIGTLMRYLIAPTLAQTSSLSGSSHR